MVSDAVELSVHAAEQAAATASGGSSSVNMSEAEWFLSEVERDLAMISNFQVAACEAAQRLKHAEQSHQQVVDDNAKEACKPFLETYLVTADLDKDSGVGNGSRDRSTFEQAMSKAIDSRVQAVALHAQCEPRDVMVCTCLDFAATTFVNKAR